MALRWEDERYVKLYTRETAEWLELPWQARGLFDELLKKADRAGLIPVGRRGVKALAALLRAPWEEIEPFVKALLEDGCLEVSAGGQMVLVRNYVEAQEAQATPAARKRDQRERDHSQARKSPESNDPCVTRSHAGSREVTRSHDPTHPIPSQPSPSHPNPAHPIPTQPIPAHLNPAQRERDHSQARKSPESNDPCVTRSHAGSREVTRSHAKSRSNPSHPIPTHPSPAHRDSDDEEAERPTGSALVTAFLAGFLRRTGHELKIGGRWVGAFEGQLDSRGVDPCVEACATAALKKAQHPDSEQRSWPGASYLIEVLRNLPPPAPAKPTFRVPREQRVNQRTGQVEYLDEKTGGWSAP